MTRTQILLRERQYRWLVARARKQNKSLSQICRELVDEKLAKSLRSRHDDSLFRLAEIGPDDAKDVAEHHDKYLYGSSKHRSK